jgi:hypothetical protein
VTGACPEAACPSSTAYVMKTSLLGLDTAELRTLMQEEGEPAYRGGQLADWIYQHGARTFDEMSSLPAALRNRLAAKYRVGRSSVVAAQQGRDGTFKLLLEMQDGARVETVGLPYADRFSCCLSTQVGCPIGCRFCASGQGGFVRNLVPAEIAEQVLTINETAESDTLRFSSAGRAIDRVVIMGMGEPLLNYESVARAVQLLNNEMGIGIRHIAVSTVGIVPGILKLAEDKPQITLAVSLHAATDELRRTLIPGHFLGWDAPVTTKVQQFLLPPRESMISGPVDLENQLIVVPTRQAGRRLREALAMHCAEQNTALLSPRVVTPAFFLHSEHESSRAANQTEVTAVWIDVLMKPTSASTASSSRHERRSNPSPGPCIQAVCCNGYAIPSPTEGTE